MKSLQLPRLQLHPSHHQESRIAFLIAAFSLIVTLGLAGNPGTQLQGLANYLPLHLLLETLSIAAALHIFAVVWHTRHEKIPLSLALIALSCLAVAILDFSHLLSYQGMPDFVTPSDPEKAINFWLAARSIGTLGLLTAAFIPWNTPTPRHYTYLALPSILLVVTALHWLFLWHQQLLPRTFLATTGLTSFKTNFEYLLILLLLLASAKFALFIRQPRQFNASTFFIATFLFAQGEFFFTLYAEVTDIYNIAGHIYKVLGFYCLYRAVFVESVQKPYELLKKSENQLSSTLNALPDILFEMSLEGRYLKVYATKHTQFHIPTSSLPGRLLHEVMPPKAAQTLLQALQEAHEQGSSWSKIVELTTPAQTSLWLEFSIAKMTPRFSQQSPKFLVVARDITAKYQAEQELHTLSLAVKQNPLAILVLNSQRQIQQINAAFTNNSGYSLAEVKHLNPTQLHSPQNRAGLIQDIERGLNTNKSWSGEIIYRHKNGQEYVEMVRIFAVFNQDGELTNYLAINEDISASKQLAHQLEQLSNHDQLTNLPNRRWLHQHFERLAQPGQPLALLWFDLDNFREINDALGFATGDLLLKQVASRLNDQLKKKEVVARVSGDDFALIMPFTHHSKVTQRIRELLEELAVPLILPEQTLSITATVGIAIYPQDAQKLDELLQKAEIGKYKAKDTGRNSYQFYETQMQERASLRLAQSNALKHAISNQELFLVYQPQICLEQNQVIGVEALLRWNSAEWGFISPMEFIPLAEANGLILPLSEWVLNQALHQLRSWLDAGMQPLTMAVNISAIQFEQEGWGEQITQALQQAQITPELLDLELTEAVAMKNPKLSEQRIEQLHQLKVQLSIDDFGTGYSSLSYLKRFKINKLKIDREFIRDMDSDQDDQAITTAIIQMAKKLAITTLAEGVETSAQLQLLHEFGCQQVQGYYFSKPLHAADVPKFVANFATTHPASNSLKT